MKNIKTSLAGFILFVILVSGFFMTCDIGLGDAVDTQPPKVSITYPPTSSIIRGAFVLAGTAADETGLSKVEVFYTGRSGTAKGVTTSVGNATIDTTNNTWRITVPAPAHDGDYDVLIEAVDNANRRTPVSRSFKIDNTPPMLVVQSPSTRAGKFDSKNNEILQQFGAAILFNGNWWDLNGNSGCAMTINFYKEDKTLLGTHKTMLNVQSWDVSLETGLPLWGTIKATCKDSSEVPGEKVATPFWYTISLEDDAYEYKDSTEIDPKAGKTGNLTSHYYLYSEIAGTLTAGDEYPNLTNLSAFDKAKTTTGIPASLHSKLEGLRIVAAPSPLTEERGKFSFDPDNKDPSISIDVLKPIPFSNPLPPQPSITIKIDPNKDKTALLNDTIKLTLIVCELNGNPTEPRNEITLKQGAEEGDFTISDIGLIKSITYNLGDTPDLVSKMMFGTYRLKVEAEDLNGHNKTEEYLFYITTGAPRQPEVIPMTPGSFTKVRTTDVDGKFTVKVLAKDTEDIVALLYLPDGTSDPIEVDNVIPVQNSTTTLFEYTWDVPFEGLTTTSPTRKVQFYLMKGNNKSSLREVTFQADNDLPKLIESKELNVNGASVGYKETVVVNSSSVNIKGFASEDLFGADLLLDSDLSLEGTLDITKFSNSAITTPASLGARDPDVSRLFNATIDILTEGKYRIWGRFTDDAYSPEQKYSNPLHLCDVIYDQSSPTITDINLNDNPLLLTLKYVKEISKISFNLT